MIKIPGGWVNIPRRLRDHPLWSSERFTVGQALVDLKLRAQHRQCQVLRGNHLVIVRPGQILTTMVALAADWGWNRETVASKLSLFTSIGLIDIDTRQGASSGYTLITIKDLEHFPLLPAQASGIPSGNGAGACAGSCPAVAQQFASNPREDLTPSEKDGPEDPGEPAQPAPVREGFATFWSAYPKKQDRKGAEKVWTTLVREPGVVEAILAALERQKTWPAWQREGGRYVPKPTTWLRGRRWEDEPGEAPGSHPHRTNTAWQGQASGEIKL